MRTAEGVGTRRARALQTAGVEEEARRVAAGGRHVGSCIFMLGQWLNHATIERVNDTFGQAYEALHFMPQKMTVLKYTESVWGGASRDLCEYEAGRTVEARGRAAGRVLAVDARRARSGGLGA